MKENILLIGCGAIGLEVTKKVSNDNDIRISQIMVRPGKENKAKKDVSTGIKIISSIDDIKSMPDFVLECASHEAVSEFGEYFLGQGIDFGVISVGALADTALFDRLQIASNNGKSQLVILSGAVGGIDALSAAKSQNLEEVVYTSRKPPKSWQGSPAETNFDLLAINEATTIFQGSASEAARLYPKNANVAATVALAGIGFDKTQVTLIADPGVERNTHHIEALGSFGQLNVEIAGNPLLSNPKSSALTAYSAVRALKNRVRGVCI